MNYTTPHRAIAWLTEEIQAQIRVIVDSDRTRETCGVVLGDGQVVALQNNHVAPEHRFAFGKEDWLAVKEGAIAIWHSHVTADSTAKLSFSDIQSAQTQKLAYACFHPVSMQWDVYDPKGTHPYPLEARCLDPKDREHYINIPFEWGRSDCAATPAHWYRGMLGIELPHPYPARSRSGSDECYENGWDKIPRGIALNGFVQVKDGSLQDNDLVVISLSHPNPHHVAILIDAERGLILHNPDEQSLTRVEHYHSDYQWKTHSVWRLP